MSDFDSGLATGLMLGKKIYGADPVDPTDDFGMVQPVVGFTDDRTPTKVATVVTASTEYSYVVSDL